MKRIVLTLVAAGLVLAVGGFLFAWSGLYDVAASRGHTAAVRWLLEFGMRNSVETHALGIKPPNLDDPALVARGAGHFQGGCAPCHGAPGAPPSAVIRHILPPPPELGATAPTWSDPQLFWIVKHGLKYTGMPGWPSQKRDDEVWAVVAFVRLLPQLDPQGYRRLALGEAAEAEPEPRLLALNGPLGEGVAACARCHGMDGGGRGLGAFPRLSGQTPEYLFAALRDYASGARPSGIMQAVAAELDERNMRLLAEHYAQARPSIDARTEASSEMIERGARLAHAGEPERGVPACASCHDRRDGAANPLFPNLHGQYAEYLALQLRLWRQGARGDTPRSQIMAAVARNLDDAQIEAVSAYYASVPRAHSGESQVGR